MARYPAKYNRFPCLTDGGQIVKSVGNDYFVRYVIMETLQGT
jgi:hypothetical protein